MSEESASERMQRERRERIEALKQLQENEKEAARELDSFADSFSQARPLQQSPPISPEPIQRTVTQVQQDQRDMRPDAPSPQKFNAIPIEFYCFVDGKVGTVSVYCLANPQSL